MNVHCLSSQMKEPNLTYDNANKVKSVMDVIGRLGLLSVEECRLWPGEARIVGLKACSDE